jgi:hypothetical protein
MGNHHGFSIGMFLFVLGLALFFIAAVLWLPPVEPYRTKIIAAGLFCVWLSTALP